MKLLIEEGDRRIRLEMFGYSKEEVREVSRILYEIQDRAMGGQEEDRSTDDQEVAVSEHAETTDGFSTIQAAFDAVASDIAAGQKERRAEKLKGYTPAHPIVQDDDLKMRISELEDKGADPRNYKISDNGKVLLYQCYYVCTNCKERGKHFIPKERKYITCHACMERMETKPSEIFGDFPTVDHYGNVYVAGDFHRVGESY